MRLLLIILLITTTTFLQSCSHTLPGEIPFESKKWQQNGDLNYPYRRGMALNIFRMHLFIGVDVKTLVDSLGNGDMKINDGRVTYVVYEDYSDGIDPSIEKIHFNFNIDSIVISHTLYGDFEN
jgi:hypothetical protein